MNFPKNPLFLFIQRIFLVLLLYTVVRLGFYFYNQSFFPEINADVFMGGLKFDLSVIGYINIVFAILHLIPGKFQENKKYQTILFYSFFLVNGLFHLSK
ncbi:MAG: sulfatase, partial [Algoriella sp.]